MNFGLFKIKLDFYSKMCVLRRGGHKSSELWFCWTHQALQDPPALVLRAEVGQDAPVDQNQTVQDQPGPEPEQGEDQGPPTGPQLQAEPPEEAPPPAAAPGARRRSSREHSGCGPGPVQDLLKTVLWTFS